MLLHYIAKDVPGILVRHQNLVFSTSTKKMENNKARGFRTLAEESPRVALEP